MAMVRLITFSVTIGMGTYGLIVGGQPWLMYATRPVVVRPLPRRISW